MPLNWLNVAQTTLAIVSAIAVIYHIHQELGIDINNVVPRSNNKKKIIPSSPKACPPLSQGVELLIGNTPLIEIKSLSRATGCKIYAKLELINPGGSAKDRVALAIIRHYEQNGVIKPHRDDVLVEGTSGSTGISLALLANAMGYKCHICLPNDTSKEKLDSLTALGCVLHPVDPASIVDPNQYTNAARRQAESINNDPSNPATAVFANQFETELNWKVHYESTGPEIYKQTNGGIDYFIAGLGTGGTIAGVLKYLKGKNPHVKVILADPQGSGLANRVNYGVMYDTVEREGTRRRHQVDTLVEGVGLNRLTHNFTVAEPFIDMAYKVTDEEAIRMAKYLCVHDGLFWGSSSAINCVAAIKMIQEQGLVGRKVVLIACDLGARHLSKFWKEASKISSDITLDQVFS
ncbi:putative mitochondrial cysteine synthase [Scheffersomyces spartinae]|uniref:Mitochondrial cysteine synthase n=1 Tax=Scheffersomyces spartinae TaxID=45513 RepID=A0A9P7V5V8_9ASCO|nr:putative mitochondrial cysteine synthase [Scheffersomyces spartinae]KAG7191810.1 putative mitochondrial cysteine synthase [Scheffersomyces spartinae]